MIKRHVRLGPLVSAAALLLVVSSGCTDEEADDACPAGEEKNPISGECVTTDDSTDGIGGGDTGSPADGEDESSDDDEGSTDGGSSDDPDDAGFEADGSDDICSTEGDADGDGLSNSCECEFGTNPRKKDSDGDGLLDGEEDANGNCQVDSGETDPRSSDTDGDGLSDAEEVNGETDPTKRDTDEDGVPDKAEIESGCMNPTDEDTDDDGLLDGEEDTNGDGKLGECSNREYNESCANGESDPCEKDTDGDGTRDGEDSKFLDCGPNATDGLTDPTMINSASGDFRLAAPPSVDKASVGNVSNAHVFDDASHNYGGFVAALSGPSGAPENLRDHVFSKVTNQYGGSNQQASGRRLTTHDGHQAIVGAAIELDGADEVGTARDAILAELAGQSSVNHSLSNSLPSAGSGEKLLFVYQVVQRSGGNYVVTGTTALQSDYEDDSAETGFRIDDLTGGASLAEASKKLEDTCVAYEFNTAPKIDFIWILDGSGSMRDENADVKNFAETFVNILESRNLDWRIGVTSADCHEIAQDSEISSSVKDNLDCSLPFDFPVDIGTNPYNNGELCDKNDAHFTRDPGKFKDCVDEVSDNGGREYTGTIGTAAIDRALPRTNNDPEKLRPGASVVTISLTDEFDEHVAFEMGWEDAQSSSNIDQLDPTQQPGFDSQKLDDVVDPFVNYYLRQDIGTTMFGVYWIPRSDCPSGTAPEAPAGIHRMVTRTGGFAGSICQSDLKNTLERIADASAGIASGLRLRGTPAPQSIEVDVGPQGGSVQDVPRSRTDGFDYDAIVNRVTFNGQSSPQNNDKVVIPYKRWKDSAKECTDASDCSSLQKQQCVEGICL